MGASAEGRTGHILLDMFLVLLVDVGVEDGIDEPVLVERVPVAVFVLGLHFGFLLAQRFAGELLELAGEEGLGASFQPVLELDADGSVEDVGGFLLVVDDFVELRQEDVVVVVEEVDFVALVVVEDAATHVEAEQQTVVVLEGLSQRHGLRAVDAHDAGDPADDDLVDVVVLEQRLPLFQDETDQVDGFADLLGLDFHGLAQLLGPLVCVLLDAFEDGLGLVGVAAFGEQLVARLVVPDLLDQYAFFEVVEVDLDVLGHFGVESEPVDRDLALDNADPEELAVVLVGTLERLVSIVEEVGGETEDGVEVVVAAEDDLPLGLLVLAVDGPDEKGKERVNGPLAFVEVHAGGGEVVDC